MIVLFLAWSNPYIDKLKDPNSFSDANVAYATLIAGAQIYSTEDSRTAACVGARFLRDGELELAEEWFDRALDLDQDDPETWLIVARAYFGAGANEKAEPLIRRTKVFCGSKRNDAFLVTMAWMFSDLGDAKRSYSALRMAVEADPHEPDHLIEWAAIASRLGDLETANERLQLAIKKSPDVGTLIAVNQVVSGDFVSFFSVMPVGSFPPSQPAVDSAFRHSERGKTLGNNFAHQLFERSQRPASAVWAGTAYLSLGNKEQAEICFQMARKRGKSQPIAMAQMAIAYNNAGEKGRANEAADLALKSALRSSQDNELIAAGWALSALQRDTDLLEILLSMRSKARVGQTHYFRIAGMFLAGGKTRSGLSLMREHLLKDANEETLYQLGLELLEGVYRNRDLL